MKTKLLSRRHCIKALAFSPFIAKQGLSQSQISKRQLKEMQFKPFPIAPCFAYYGDQDLILQTLEGELPRDLIGSAFIMESLNTPEKVNLAAARGAIARYDFQDQTVQLKKRLIQTPSAIAFDHFQGTRDRFKKHGFAYIQSSLGPANFCNTNFVSIGGNRLGISYDAVRPFEIDPQTLEVRTPIGGNHEWRSALPKIAGFVSRKWPFKLLRATAHPYFDQQTGEFFSVNFDTSINTALGTFGSTFLNIMKWDGKTDIKAWQVLDIKGKPIRIKEAVHSICITRHHIIIIDTPFSLEIEQLLGSKVHRAPASRTPFYIIKRRDLNVNTDKVLATQFTLNKEWEHVVADYEDDEQIFRLIGASSPATDFSESLLEGDRLKNGEPINPDLIGMLAAPMDEGGYGIFHVAAPDPANQADASVIQSQQIEAQDRGWLIALMSWRGNNGTPNRFEYMYWTSFGFHPDLLTKRIYRTLKDYPFRKTPLDQMPTSPIPSALQRLDTTSAVVDQSWDAPDGWILASPQFIPRKHGSSRQDDGYIIVIASSDEISEQSSGRELWIFAADDIARGPLCRLGHKELKPGFTLHSTWLSALTTSPDEKSYKISAKDDFGEEVGQQKRSIRDFFEKEIYPRF